MTFWAWLNREDGRKFGTAKRMLVAAFVFLVIPMLLYALITWDPIIYYDEDGEPQQLGIYVVVALYWVGAYFVYKRYQAKERLNRFLDELLVSDEEDFIRLLSFIESRRAKLKKRTFMFEEGEDRVKWFISE